MNWGDFKKQVEEQGVKDKDEIFVIDTSGNFTDNLEVKVSKEEDRIRIYAYDR